MAGFYLIIKSGLVMRVVSYHSAFVYLQEMQTFFLSFLH